MTIPRVLKTGSFRLAALYAALFVASTVLLFGIVYWVTTRILDDQTRATIRAEMEDMVGASRDSSPDALAQQIAQEIADKDSQDVYYGLQDSDGRLLAGDLPAFSGQLGWQVTTARLPAAGKPDGTGGGEPVTVPLLVLSLRVDGDRTLSIAHDMSGVVEVQEAIASAFAWAGAAGVMLALVGGVALSHGFLRRIDELNRTARGIMAGNLSERIRLSGAQDELDQLGSNLNAMLDRLQASMDSLKQVSNDIAHDLRTPLSRLKQRLELALLEAETMQDYAQAVDDAIQQVNTALVTFGALLRIAQIESGVRRPTAASVDLSGLVEHLGATYDAVAEDLGKSLVMDIAPGQSVQGDRDLLTQMLVNLIENALRHTPAGARVTIAVRRRDGGPVAEVSDNGPGIPESERENVFRRFYRLEASRSTPGNGLGLAMVAAIAAHHRAAIRLVDNRPGLRAVVSFPDPTAPAPSRAA